MIFLAGTSGVAASATAFTTTGNGVSSSKAVSDWLYESSHYSCHLSG
jgi:hypothetical protein